MALADGVWVGFRPSTLVGVPGCRGRALGGGVGRGLGSVRQEGDSEGRGLGLGAQQASQYLSGQGKHWPHSLPFLRAPPPPSPLGSPPLRWTPSRWVPLGVGTPPSPSHHSGVPVLEVQPLLLLPLPSLPLPQDPRSWRRSLWAEDQARDLSRFLGAQVGRGSLATLPFDLLPSQWFPNFPLWVWDPFPSPSRPSGPPVPSHLHLSSSFTPPKPHVLPGHWGVLPFP